MSYYRIERLIGKGGMALVYQARWFLPNGQSLAVACKLMREERGAVAHYRRLVSQEAVLSLRLNHNHPNLVTVLDFFEDAQNRLCMVLEFIRGVSVRSLLDAYRQLPHSVLRLVITKVIEALVHLHSHKVLHRDLSPCNILVSTAGEVKVSDLGLAKIMEQGQARTRTFRGKPVYASPEALRCAALDERSDLYSFGVILYELLSGELPWGDERDVGRITARMRKEDFAPLPADTPPEFADLTMGLLRWEADMRHPQSAAEVLSLLRSHGEPMASPLDLGEMIRPVQLQLDQSTEVETTPTLAPGEVLMPCVAHSDKLQSASANSRIAIKDKPDMPVNARPVNSRPVNSRPVNSRPVNSRPINSRSVNSRSVNNRPVNDRPINDGSQPRPRQIERVPQSGPLQPVRGRPFATRTLESLLLAERRLRFRWTRNIAVVVVGLCGLVFVLRALLLVPDEQAEVPAIGGDSASSSTIDTALLAGGPDNTSSGVVRRPEWTGQRGDPEQARQAMQRLTTDGSRVGVVPQTGGSASAGTYPVGPSPALVADPTVFAPTIQDQSRLESERVGDVAIESDHPIGPPSTLAQESRTASTTLPRANRLGRKPMRPRKSTAVPWSTAPRVVESPWHIYLDRRGARKRSP